MTLPLPILFILDPETDFVFKTFRNSNKFVLSEEDWSNIDKNNLAYSAIVILAELSWGNQTQADYSGFSIGLELRRKYKCLLPIVITSSLSQRQFELLSASELKYNLLYARGTTFIPLLSVATSLDDHLKSLQPISLPLLTDMNEMLFNLQGVLTDSLGHRLRAEMSTESLDYIMLEMQSFLNEEQIIETHWEYYYAKLKETLSNDAVFSNIKLEFLNTLKIAIPSTVINVGNDLIEKRHHILIIEDNEVFAKEIQSNLNVYFNKISITDNADEAIEILTNDTSNEIVGIVSDWRLYKNANSKYWQKQGYEILEFAAKNKFTALFGITSLSDTNVHSIRNLLGFEIHLFKKEHFVGSNANALWKIMADTILQKCDAVCQLIASEPSGSGWLKLKNEYLLNRNNNWLSFESAISQEAHKIFSFYRDAIENDNVRNVFSINEMGISLKNNLKNILIIRRVFLGLYAYLNKYNEYLQEIRPIKLLGTGEKVDTNLRHHGIDTYSIIRKDWWDDIYAGIDSTAVEDEWDKMEQRIKNFRNVLCIDISELPHRGLLPEEKSWMKENNIDFSFLYKYWLD